MPRGVYKRTKENTKNLYKIPKGTQAWNKGKTWTQETRNKISQSNKGKKISESSKEILLKYAKGNKNMSGKHHTLETKQKISESLKGEKSYLWKGGVTPVNEKIRKSLEVKLWKKACLERDNFTCQKTGQKGGKLEVHHINNFADFPELRTSLENGITLSQESHREFHKIYGKRNNTMEQLQEFLGITKCI